METTDLRTQQAAETNLLEKILSKLDGSGGGKGPLDSKADSKSQVFPLSIVNMSKSALSPDSSTASHKKVGAIYYMVKLLLTPILYGGLYQTPTGRSAIVLPSGSVGNSTVGTPKIINGTQEKENVTADNTTTAGILGGLLGSTPQALLPYGLTS